MENITNLTSRFNIVNRKYKKRHIQKGLVLLTFILPGLIYYITFHYAPMYGVIIAFKEYNPFVGFSDSPWVGVQHFKTFFDSLYFGRLLRNTFLLSFFSLIFGFPMPILFALLMYEIKRGKIRSLVQSISYFPHFISTVVICGLIRQFTATDSGIINALIELFGGTPINFLGTPGWFRSVYIISGIWQGMGWSSIIYYATLTSIDTSLFESADIDGATRLQKIYYISIPALVPTIVTLLLMNLGNLMNVGYEKVLLLYNSSIYETADIISTYVYRQGIVNLQYSFAAAVGLFNSVIGICIIIIFNGISKRMAHTSLW